MDLSMLHGEVTWFINVRIDFCRLFVVSREAGNGAGAF